MSQASPVAGLPQPIRLAGLTIGAPFALAPMAGVTNPPFRALCREFAAAALRDAAPQTGGGFAEGGLGLYIAEMVMARAVVERNKRSLRILRADADPGSTSIDDDGASVLSAQVYGVDPATTGKAVAVIAGEGLAGHIDLNFGCPVPKVTRKGGGGALPWKTQLFAAIVRAAVVAAEPYQVPITVKTRIGIDDAHETYVDAARAAAEAGAAAITLHARTVAQRYSGDAHWESISELVQLGLPMPVFGNGDIFAADDALRMFAETGCAGVAVGRGALGRPWLFADLIHAFHGSNIRYQPSCHEVVSVIRNHVAALIDYYGSETRGVRDMRKHIIWYLRGFPIGGETRNELVRVDNLAQLDDGLNQLPDYPHPVAAEGPRGRMGGPQRPNLPHGWLDSRDLTPRELAELKLTEVMGVGDTGG